MRSAALIVLLGLLSLSVFAHGGKKYPFIQNKGQWDGPGAFKVNLPDGALFLEQAGFTYHLMDRSYIKRLHTAKPLPRPESIQHHGLFVRHLNFNPSVTLEGKDSSSYYSNYLIGPEEKHRSWVRSFRAVRYKALYSGIDLEVYHTDYGYLKYDYILAPGANPKAIRTRYDGADKVYLRNGHLVVETSITRIVEQKPIAYQYIKGDSIPVSCKFKLKDGVLSYAFPKGWNKSYELIIDPILIFSSFTGSGADNFGFTATYDAATNTYAGGIVFSSGNYPTTAGAYQTGFNGSIGTDIGITKFDQAGGNLIYSTYLGGSDSEAPHSLVVNSSNELYIFGTTASNDFPTLANAYQQHFAGGTPLAPTSSGMNYTNGTDILVARLNATGTGLVAATLLGGTGNDGANEGDSLVFNYGDPFRGEIILDQNEHPIVATTTSSTNFPMAGGSPQSTYGGGDTDGCAFRFNPNLTTLEWSTFIGGSGEDSGYGIQLNSSGEMYVTGGTGSKNLNVAGNAHQNSNSGGIDGYLMRYSPSGNNLLSSTYLGTPQYDQCYFVQIDLSDDVYVVGQTEGTYPVTPGLYANPNSGQFLHKLTNDLTTSIWSTTVGRSTGEVDFSPSAFLVNNCGLIYLSGWGGTLNGTGTYQANFSSTTNLPITNDAYQSSTDGSDFYLMVLNNNASGLLYSTYFGGSVSQEHVDGGTSRFDKNGVVYQAVCAGCGGNNDFPTTPGAWSQVNGSSNCNLGVFKFGLGNINTAVSIPTPYVCIPSSYQFINNSVGGNEYLWDFGDGNTSTDFEPNHVYTDTGTFTVSLVVSDSTGCIESDTAYLQIMVMQLGDANVEPVDTICPGETVMLEASGGLSYQWIPSTYLSNPNSSNPIANPPVTTDYLVLVTDSCGTDTAYTTIFVHETPVSISNDTVVCGGSPVPLEATGGVQYSWSPTTGLSNPNTSNPTAIVLDTTQYLVDITTVNGCVIKDSVTINTISNLPVPIFNDDTTICLGDSLLLQASGAPMIEYISPQVFGDPFNPNQWVHPVAEESYQAAFTNQCGTVYDTVHVGVYDFKPVTSPDRFICPNDSVEIWASGAEKYSWSPSSTVLHPDSSNTLVFPDVSTNYVVTLTSTIGCTKQASVSVGIYPLPYVDAGNDQYIVYGGSTTLHGVSNPSDTSYWTTTDSLSCYACPNPEVRPEQTTIYYYTTIDENGCLHTDEVVVYVDGSLYVPNAFTPNGDGVNDIFHVQGRDIVEYELLIFNRWGELFFESNNLDTSWDGTYKGKVVQIDVYVWKIRYKDSWGREEMKRGHVSVVR